jgi:VCBS repeat-containing protein
MSRSPTRSPFRPIVHLLEDRTVPSADPFAEATPLTGSLITVTGSNVGATAELGEPSGEGTSGTINSVWWSWTAPASTPVEVNTIGSTLDTVLAVYTGDAVDALTLVAANDDAFDTQSQLLFDAVAGQTYRIAVDGFADATGDIVLKLGVRPGNDNFAGAPLSAGGTEVGGNLAATGESGEPLDGTNGTLNTVWWSWTASASETVEISTIGSGFDTILAIYTGDAVDDLTLIAVNDDYDFPNSLASRIAFNASAGMTYHIAVDGYLNETGNVVLNLPPVPPPPPPPPVNNPPSIVGQTMTVNENSAVGTAIGVVAASDPDAGQGLSFSIEGGNPAGAFAIDSTTGAITVANSSALDHEANGSYVLTVRVTDDGSPALSAAADMTVTVADVNEAPIVAAAGPFAVVESAAAGTEVGTVTASDPDAGQNLTYAIVAGNSGNAFAIDSATGRITVANGSALDYESQPTFNLTIRVADDGSPALSATTNVAITLNDRNDAPVLDNSGAMALNEINAGQTNNPGTLVADLIASAGGNRITDQDAGAAEGIAIIAANTSNGSWQFSTNGGATWQALGTVSAGSARLLAADARIRFVPNLLYSGTITTALTFRAWDQTSGINGGLADTTLNGGSIAFSVVTETASLSVRGLLGLGLLGL